MQAMAVLLILFLAGQILLCLYLLGIILGSPSLRKQVAHWFVLNAVAANLLFSLIIRPGTIHQFEQLVLAEYYCRVFNILHHVEQVCVPAMLLMFTLDRMVYVRNPNAYGQEMSFHVVLILLILPWVVSVAIGMVCAFGFSGENMLVTISSRYDEINGTMTYCGYDEKDTQFNSAMMIFEALASLAVALSALVVTVLVLYFYFRYKRELGFNRVYCQLGSAEMSYVKDATICVCLLNLLFLGVFVSHFLVMEFVGVAFNSNAIYLFFEFLEMVIFMFAIGEVRRATFHLCRKRERPEAEQQVTLRYVANAEEVQ